MENSPDLLPDDVAALRAELIAARAKPSIQSIGETKAITIPVSPPLSEFVRMDDDQIKEALAAAAALYQFYHEHLSVTRVHG